MLYALTLFGLLAFYLGLDTSYTHLNVIIPFFQILLGIHLLLSLYNFSRGFHFFNRSSKAIFTLLTAFYLALAILYHPGMVNSDTFDIQYTLANGRLSDWQTILYSLIFGLFVKLDQSAFLLTLFHVYILMACFYKCLRIAPARSAGGVALYLILGLLPLIQFTVLFLSRDILFGLLTAYLLLEFAEKYFRREPADFRFTAFTFLLVFVLSELRQDAKLYVLFYPLLLWSLGPAFSTAKKAVLGILLVAMSLAANGILMHKKIFTAHQLYQFTGILHPLSYIAHSVPEEVSPETRQTLSRVISFDDLVQGYEPLRIAQFHNQKYTLPVSEEHWRQFVAAYLGLIAAHPGLFLRERLSMLAATLNLWDYPFISASEFKTITTEQAHFVRDTQGVKEWSLAPELQKSHLDLTSKLVYGRGIRLWFGSPIAVFMLAFLLLACRRHYTRFFLAATVFYFSRFPVVFLMAPEPQMKYYSPILYFPVFMILILALFRDPEKDTAEVPGGGFAA